MVVDRVHKVDNQKVEVCGNLVVSMVEENNDSFGRNNDSRCGNYVVNDESDGMSLQNKRTVVSQMRLIFKIRYTLLSFYVLVT